MAEKITVELIRDQWSKTYNTEGKPDWSHIFPYYHQDIIFQDSIQRVEGKEAFLGVCNRLARRCSRLNMELPAIVKEGGTIFMQWEMTMIFRRTPSSTLYGCSKLMLNEDETLILNQRDYYDLWGDIFDNIPVFGKIYRRFMHRKFG